MIRQVECSNIIQHAREIVKENKLDNGELTCEVILCTKVFGHMILYVCIVVCVCV